MIGKIPKPGKSFKGCIEYNMLKHGAELLYSEGIRTENVRTIIADFNMQRKVNPALGQAVGHISLSWSIHDKDKLSGDRMVEYAKEYMEKMKITNTQYMIAMHTDRPHPHLHIVYNRVNNAGKTISDKFQRQLNIQACKELNIKHGFYIAPGKEDVNRQQLKGADKVKYELYDIISKQLKNVQSWEQLEKQLLMQAVTMQFKYKSGTTEIQGISFSRWDVKFKGSEIDRSLSYAKINQRIGQNQQAEKQAPNIVTPTAKTYKAPTGSQSSINHADDLLKALIAPTPAENTQDYSLQTDMYKRKRKRKNRHL